MVRLALLVVSLMVFGCGSNDGEPTGSEGGAPATGGSSGASGSGGANTGGGTGSDYVIVAADSLAASAARYRDFRVAEGHDVKLALVSELVKDAPDNDGAVTQIRDFISTQYDARNPGAPFFVLLIGDADGPWKGSNDTIPTGEFYDAFTSKQITSDNVYADMDGDNVPDLALGRLPLTSDDQVDAVRAKVEAYEKNYEVGAWNRRFNLFASTPGYGPSYDPIIEQWAFDIVEAMPYPFDITMTYASQPSPYVYVPEKFSDKVYERINEGSLMVTYIGHGLENQFANLKWNGKLHPILDTAQLSKLDARHRPPILTLVACLTGKFDTGESLSEAVLKTPGGPPAVLSATEISNPVNNGIFIYELAQTLGAERAPTVGEAFVRAKHRLLENDDAIRSKIAGAATLVLKPGEMDALNATHLHMYTLFGDPAMRLAYPKSDATVDVSPTKVAAGGQLKLDASLPRVNKGTAYLTLETKRSVIAGALVPVPADGEPGRDDAIMANYQTANDKVVAKLIKSFDGGKLSTTLTVPAGLDAGTYYVKLYADDGTTDAIGATAIEVMP